MIDGTGHVDSEKWVHCTNVFKWISIACSKVFHLRPFIVWRKTEKYKSKKKKKKKYSNLCSQIWFEDLCCHTPSSLSHGWIPVMYLSLCNWISFQIFLYLFLFFEGLLVIIDISLVFIDYVLTYGKFLQQFVIQCDSILWRHRTNSDSAILFCSGQVDLLIWGGNSALNPACSLWQYYLWTVVGHTVFWGCQML